jgi:hypothetical protein
MDIPNLNTESRGPIVSFLGGTLHDNSQIEFARQLGKNIAEKTTIRICVSGYKGDASSEGKNRFFPSFEYCIATAAAQALDDRGIRNRIITKHTKPLDQYPHHYTIGKTVASKGKNARSRRLSIISDSDLVCLGAGNSKEYKDMYDFATAIDIPVIPLPFFGGNLRRLWLINRKDIVSEIEVLSDVVDWWTSILLENVNSKTIMKIVYSTINAIISGVKKRCLVFMPFAEHFKWVYERVLEPAAIIACIDLIRIDLQQYVGDIVGKFRDELSKSDFVVAVVTGENANVFYEIGFSHAIGKEVLLLCQQGISSMQTNDPPFYVRNHRVVWYPSQFDEMGIKYSIDEICSLMRGIKKVEGKNFTRHKG